MIYQNKSAYPPVFLHFLYYAAQCGKSWSVVRVFLPALSHDTVAEIKRYEQVWYNFFIRELKKLVLYLLSMQVN